MASARDDGYIQQFYWHHIVMCRADSHNLWDIREHIKIPTLPQKIDSHVWLVLGLSDYLKI